MNQFDNWPNNLPREDLIRYVKAWGRQKVEAEIALARLYPDQFPVATEADAELWTPGDPIYVDEELPDFIDMVVAELTALRQGRTAL